MNRFFLVALLAGIPALAVEPAGKISGEITVDSVISAMNDYRAQKRLPPLHGDQRLMRAAEDRMRDMEELGYWGHDSPEGRSPFFWVRYRAYRFACAGENLARGFETADLLVHSWMGSPGHRENILGVEYHHVGVAVIDGATTGRFPGRSVVVLFARELQ